MQFYAIWPYFVCMAIVLALVSTRIFATADTPPNPGRTRVSTIDGLRGFLAFGVFFHHGAIYHGYLLDGAWVLPPSRFYALLGQGGVALFFMITGYLFWGRMIAERGRPNWLRLYVGRIFRIGPLYLFAVAAMTLIVMQRTGWTAQVPSPILVKQIAHWSMLGLGGPGPDINAYSNSWIVLAGVTWTLDYEWKFYLSLIVIALSARSERTHLPFVVVGLLFCLGFLWLRPVSIEDPTGLSCAALFLTGMLCASLERQGWMPKLPDAIGSILILVLACAPLAGIPGVRFLLGGIFFLIVDGASLFGLLKSRPARRLGDISYGIYLLQGLVLTLVFSSNTLSVFAIASPAGHWLCIFGTAVLLLFVAAATLKAIERTGIDLGKRILPSITKNHYK